MINFLFALIHVVVECVDCLHSLLTDAGIDFSLVSVLSVDCSNNNLDLLRMG